MDNILYNFSLIMIYFQSYKLLQEQLLENISIQKKNRIKKMSKLLKFSNKLFLKTFIIPIPHLTVHIKIFTQ